MSHMCSLKLFEKNQVGRESIAESGLHKFYRLKQKSIITNNYKDMFLGLSQRS